MAENTAQEMPQQHAGGMTITVRVPTRIVYRGGAAKLTARAENGLFGVLPAHVDFVAALAPGVLSITQSDGTEQLFGHDQGVFVKHRASVDICVRRAVAGANLTELQDAVIVHFFEVDEAERAERTSLARLEASVMRRLSDLGAAR